MGLTYEHLVYGITDNDDYYDGMNSEEFALQRGMEGPSGLDL